MEPYEKQKKSFPATGLKLFWQLLPMGVLVCMILVIVVLSARISEEKERIAAKQAEAVTSESPAVNVVVLELSPSPIKDALNLPGIIEPWTDLQMLSKIQGTVQKVLVAEGDEVNTGDVIAEIDPADYAIAVEAAEASYRLAQADLKRSQALFAKEGLAQADLDTARTRVETLKAELDRARLQLSRCHITAPICGVIRKLDAKEGLLLSVADPVARILRLDKVKAVVGIPESDVDAVRSLEQVDVTIQALHNRTITGTKKFLAPSPDNKAWLYQLELAMDNPERTILPGMFVRADVVKERVAQALSVPLYSVITRNGDKFVYVEENNTAVRRPVQLGITEKWLVQVTDGLRPGERVIVEGHRNVEHGQAVRVVKVMKSIEDALL